MITRPSCYYVRLDKGGQPRSITKEQPALLHCPVRANGLPPLSQSGAWRSVIRSPFGCPLDIIIIIIIRYPPQRGHQQSRAYQDHNQHAFEKSRGGLRPNPDHFSHPSASSPERRPNPVSPFPAPRPSGRVDRRLSRQYASISGVASLIGSRKNNLCGCTVPVGVIGRPPVNLSGSLPCGAGQAATGHHDPVSSPTAAPAATGMPGSQPAYIQEIPWPFLS
jgi:hypothetical protein